MKETETAPYLPNLFTPNPVMTETDFRILEWSLRETYPVIAAEMFTIPDELAEWKLGPPSWQFCGTAALLVCRIYPTALLAYDRHNNHGFNLIPKTLPVNNMGSIKFENYAEIDLTRDQFIRYVPEITCVSAPGNDTFLSSIFTDVWTTRFHLHTRTMALTRPDIRSASPAIQTWVRST